MYGVKRQQLEELERWVLLLRRERAKTASAAADGPAAATSTAAAALRDDLAGREAQLLQQLERHERESVRGEKLLGRTPAPPSTEEGGGGPGVDVGLPQSQSRAARLAALVRDGARLVARTEARLDAARRALSGYEDSTWSRRADAEGKLEEVLCEGGERIEVALKKESKQARGAAPNADR